MELISRIVTPSRVHFLATIISTVFLHLFVPTVLGDEPRSKAYVKSGARDLGQSWSEALQHIEMRLQPPMLQSGDRRYETLPAYYWAANQELRTHLDRLVNAYDRGDAEALTGVTLIAGTAGVGKTFIKSGLLNDDIAENDFIKFDIRDWYLDFHEKGLAEYRADLVHGDEVMCQLLRLNHRGRKAFSTRLNAMDHAFLVIDSLDEVHPDDYLFILQTVQEVVAAGRAKTLHAFVFGRPLVFRAYWHRCCSENSLSGLNCFVLHPPELVSTGDLMVSSWNYHCWKYRLEQVAPSGESIPMPLEDYEAWRKACFTRDGPYSGVNCNANQSLQSKVQDELDRWATTHPSVASVLGNLAGNSMVREIVEEFVLSGKPFDERGFKEEFFSKWLERDTFSGDRPSRLKPQDLELYIKLLESVAVMYANEAIQSSDGFFEVGSNDEAVVLHNGALIRVPVERLLNRSGLVNLDSQRPGDARYRFEPLWFHRWLVGEHQTRSKEQLRDDNTIVSRTLR